MILNILFTALVIIVIGGVIVIGLISAVVLFAAVVVTVEHFRLNQKKSPRPPRAWRKRTIEEKLND